jgi:hypothetical protein
MRQRLRSHLTYANVMVTMLAFIVLGGGTALAALVVSSNSQIGPNTIYGHKAPSGANKNIIAGSVNGQDVADNSLTGLDINEPSLTGDVQKLVYNAGGSPPQKIAKVGPYEIDGECVVGFTSTEVKISALGPAGTADDMFDATQNDTSDLGTLSHGLLIPANTRTEFASTNVPSGENFKRIAGTAMLKSGSVLVQVEFNAVADNRGPGSCFVYGTATRAT